MKHAYVSVVLPTTTTPSPEAIRLIDELLESEVRSHEIVIVTPYGQPRPFGEAFANTGPVTIVTTHMRSTRDGAILAGLARAVGDFVLEWRGTLDSFDREVIRQMLAPTDAGIELVEVIGVETSLSSRVFNRVVNRLRAAEAPLRKTIGRTFSRHAVQAVLGASAFEPQLDVLTAELPVQRSLHATCHANPHDESRGKRIRDGLAILSKGTRFGSAIPLALAAASALFGFAAAIYALGFLLFRGRTPEGWTTLMVVIGLGQAAILVMAGLTWTRIDALTRGLSRTSDATAQVEVWPPIRETHDGE